MAATHHGSATSSEVEHLVRALSGEFSGEITVNINLSAASYIGLLESSCPRVAIAFTESSAAVAAAVATAAAMTAEQRSSALAGSAGMHSVLGPQISFMSNHEVLTSKAPRVIFTTTEVLSFHLQSPRPDPGCAFDSVLLCNIEPSDQYSSLVAGDASKKNIQVVHAHALCDDESRKRSMHKALSAEVCGDDIFSFILQQHDAVKQSGGNIVVFMIDDDISKFIDGHKRELNKIFSVVQLGAQSPTSQLLNLADSCQKGGLLIFASVLSVHQCSILPNVELVIDSCNIAQELVIDGFKRIVPVVPATPGFTSKYENLLSESIHRASCGRVYVRVLQLQQQIQLYSRAMYFHERITSSETSRAGLISRDLAAVIAAMFLECGIVLSEFTSAIHNMTPEDIAKLAARRAGIQSDACVSALRRCLQQASVSDFSPESLLPALENMPFFQLHPDSIQPIISALAGIQMEAASSATRLTPETIKRMCPEDIAKHAIQRAGIYGIQSNVAWLRDDAVAQLIGNNYKEDWQHEHLSNLFADSRSPYFRSNPTHREPIIMALVSMRVEAESLSMMDEGNDANEKCDVDVCIAAALRALASVSSHTYCCDTVERRHMRQLAATALSFTAPLQSSCTMAQRLFLVQVEKRLQQQTPFQEQLVTKFQLHLATSSNLAFESFKSVIPQELLPPAAPRSHSSAAIEDHSVAQQAPRLPLPPALAAIVIGCCECNMAAEGLIAAATILAGGPFWKSGADDPAVTTAVAAVIDEIKAKNATSKDSAMNSASFGRLITQFAPNFKEAVKTELKNEPSLVFFGERGSQFVYFHEDVSRSSQSAQASSQVTSGAVNARDFTACVAVVASCISRINPGHSDKYIYSDFVENMSRVHKVERKTLSAILRQVSALMHHFNSTDVDQCTWAPSSFAAMLRQSQTGDCKFPPMKEWSCESFNRAAFESVVMQQAKSLGSKCYHVSCDGKVKAAVLRCDGTLYDVSTPLTFDESDPPCTSCTCFSLAKKQGLGGISMDLFIRNDEVVSYDTVVIPLPATVLDIMIKHGALPVQPGCFISIRSSQELSIFGPQEAVKFAVAEVKQLMKSITEKLTRVPCVVPVNGATLSFGYKYSLGLGARVTSVMSPSDTNVLIISDVRHIMRFASENRVPFSNVENLETQLFTAVTTRLQSAGAAIPLPLDLYFEAASGAHEGIEGEADLASAKKNAPCPMANVVFGSANDARIAYEMLSSEFAGSVHLPVEECYTTRQSGTAFRVAFAVSHFEQSPSEDVAEDAAVTMMKPIWYCGRQLFPVNMNCGNYSAWHSDRELSAPLPKAVCCTHHVKRLNVAALRAAKMKLGYFFPHTGQIAQHDAAGAGYSEQPEGARSLKYWTCCNQPSCDTVQMDEAPSVACPSAFREHLKGFPHLHAKQMFSCCWERHYFASESDQLEAFNHPSAIQYAHNLDVKLTSKPQPPPKPQPPAMQRAPGDRAEHQYSLVFVDQRHKQEASARMTAERRVGFQFGRHLQHLTGATFDFNIAHGTRPESNQIHFSVSSSGYDGGRRGGHIAIGGYAGRGEYNRVLDRTALHGVLKTRLCVGILEMSVKEEAISNVEQLLPKLQETIMKDILLPVIQNAGVALFTSVMPDPAVVTSSAAKSSNSSFRGVFGCQMISFLIQTPTPEVHARLKQMFTTSTLGRALKSSVSTRGFQTSCTVECCDVSNDTALSSTLPLDAADKFLSALHSACERCHF